MERHSRIYETIEEKLLRFEIFKDNLFHIDDTNKKAANYWLGLNEFADLTHEEFKPVNTRRDTVNDSSSSSLSTVEIRSNIPKAVDWRKKGAVTPVKNQGSCGSCWALSTIAAIEGINQIVTGNLTALSEQELIDCDTSYNNGCNGGLMDYAFAYIASTASWQAADAKVVTISGYKDVPANNEQSLLKALANQPLSVAIDASGRDFQFYSGGVFDGHCGTSLDHGVAAVGYGSGEKGLDYVIVKNSWGPKWGEKGFIRMKRNTNKPERMCGLYKMASYPTKSK
ncbi:unnamed protein product [Linum tenue]|uniref:Uncharacterized protein n=1 Tax=Linum tenue TaxID=586396 RepID=A0AAV0H956_9ROSI|nr:unnamed protein product [Linum tenue]